MSLLKVLSVLMDYPNAQFYEHQADIKSCIEASSASTANKQGLLAFVDQRATQNLLDWQEDYDTLFERGRSLGLWLFEHVHGESRDRGQAMVDLTAKYREAGLHISEHQLPDYIPMFLEFLSTQGEDSAGEWLRDVEHILALLQCRLERRGSDYSVMFATLLALAKSKVDLEVLRTQVAAEKRDDSKKAIDKEWQEEEVTFGADSLDKSCDAAKRKPTEAQRKDLDVPMTWVGFNEVDTQSEGVVQ
jgi:nitrate reductase delta subunit